MSDLIRRSDAVVAIANLHVSHDREAIFKAYAENPHSMTTDFEGTLIDAINAVEALPSADRPQGEWIIEEFLWGGYVRMKKPKCSVCKIGIDHLATVLEDGSGWDMYKTADGSFRNLPRFCPNCGARMFAKDTNVPNKKGADDE